MKAHTLSLGFFAGLALSQSTTVPVAAELLGAIDQCGPDAFKGCPADISAPHRCLKFQDSTAGLVQDTCVSSCPQNSPCLTKCGTNRGKAWCGAAGACYCDQGWDSAIASPGDPYDLSWVKKWAAIGDSYSAGIGSGSPYANTSSNCARYDQSYPAYMQSHELMPETAKFEFLACSGATGPEILADQVPAMGTGYDIITVSAGGNDVGLTSILNACVFQWNPFANCADEMQATLNLIRGTLPGNLDKLYAGLKGKINTGRKIYVTGYATFFDNTTTACDSVSWSFWFNSANKQRLTTERRSLMNELTRAVNSAIAAAVQRAGPSFEFVDYDQYFTVLQGRFCEGATVEPDGNRDGLLFFEWSTKNDGTTLARREAEPEVASFDNEQVIPRATPTIDEAEVPSVEMRSSKLGLLSLLSKRTGQMWRSFPRRQAADANTRTPVLEVRAGAAAATSPTIEQYIADQIGEARKRNSSLVVSTSDNTAADPRFRGRSGLQVSDFIGDEIKRVFHPRPGGHAVIANLLMWRLAEDNAAAIGKKDLGVPEAAGCAAPVPTEQGMPDKIPGVVVDCQLATLNCLNCIGGASSIGFFVCSFQHHSNCNACGGSGKGCPC
ncbi:hypothetical protein CORC01_07396 [Colletotrichum orchidophilum]|uniref:SGNH hydrolase-type esterase domain-containing protein n=1 Tax=Colletotrichum orchidophilum TaxID=1209926 RepID=A0A1G4B7E4_9PEZI|nr:uncharacterized protein CORC01_07396 [Colletotrichum orchidophilum]OHE97341.1 hypothetical protein CORC01_07396 [Colletotrichum orchidophilum]